MSTSISNDVNYRRQYGIIRTFEDGCSKAISDLGVDRNSVDIYRKLFAFINNVREPEDIKIAIVNLVVAVSNPGKDYYAALVELVKEAVEFSINWGEVGLRTFNRNIKCGHLNDVLTAFELCNRTELDDSVIVELEKLQKGEVDFAMFLDSLKRIGKYVKPIQREIISRSFEMDSKNMKPLLERFEGNDPNVNFPIQSNLLAVIEKQFTMIEDYCIKWQHERLSWLISEASIIRARAQFLEDDIMKLFAIARVSLYDTCKLYLHHTQVLAVLGLSCFDLGCMAQVKTGEGKSLMTALLAFVLAMQNKSVHIISSARTLSIRDQAYFSDFFQLFGIETSHICKDDCNEYSFKAQILYGTPSDFEFGIMREMLYLTPLFEQEAKPMGQKRFDCVIVDEVDNLTIDTARNHSRLSFPTEEDCTWVYQPILNFVKERFKKDSNEEELGSQSVLQKVKEVLHKVQPIPVQDDRLKLWLGSAFIALFKVEEQKHYIVERSITNDEILIVDAQHTGRLMHSNRWSSGLHEFVEIKHGIEPKKESLVPITLAHSVLYQMYGCIYGVTGTLGSKLEREEIKEIYQIDSFDVPTYNPCIRLDQATKVFFTNSEWLQAILKAVKFVVEQGRPVLVLAETISDSTTIENLLKGENISLEMLNGIQQKSEEHVLNLAGSPGAVTIATNTAGRGTDIKLAQRSIEHGGLHVLMTFFPCSERVEYQARGRAGRQGEPGSSEIIMSMEQVELSEEVKPITREEAFQKLEQKRVAETHINKHVHICLAEMERYIFSFVVKFFTSIMKFDKISQEEDCIKKCEQLLSSQRVAPKQDLSREEYYLALRATDLFKVKNKTAWRVFLYELSERIKHSAILNWVAGFYKEVEKLLIKSKLVSNALIVGHLTHFLDKQWKGDSCNAIVTLTNDAMALEIVNLKEEIGRLFDIVRCNWENHLDPTSSGILEYIQRITVRIN